MRPRWGLKNVIDDRVIVIDFMDLAGVVTQLQAEEAADRPAGQDLLVGNQLTHSLEGVSHWVFVVLVQKSVLNLNNV